MQRIFIVDDHPMMRSGLRALLMGEKKYEVCGEAATARDALHALESLQADLVLLDLTLPDRSGLELLKDLHALRPDRPVLVLSMHDEMLYAERVIRAGGRGYLVKGASAEQILSAVETVLAGSVFLGERAARHILDGLSRNSSKGLQSRLERLSDREIEIFELFGHGWGNTEIGTKLGISPRTVDAHRTNIRSKLGLPDSQAVMREAVIWVELGGILKHDGLTCFLSISGKSETASTHRQARFAASGPSFVPAPAMGWRRHEIIGLGGESGRDLHPGLIVNETPTMTVMGQMHRRPARWQGFSDSHELGYWLLITTEPCETQPRFLGEAYPSSGGIAYGGIRTETRTRNY